MYDKESVINFETMDINLNDIKEWSNTKKY